MGDLIYIAILAVAYFAIKALPQELIVRVRMGVLGRFGLENMGPNTLASQPDRITLEPKAGPPAREEAASAIRSLERRGFQPAGSFFVREIAGVVVHLMAKPLDGAIAVVYEHARAGVWCDLASRFIDGSSFTVTSARAGASLEPRPGHHTVRAPGQPAAMLHVRLLNERPAGERDRIQAADVARHFTESYEASMAWRKGRGISAQEVRGAALERAG